MPSKEQILRGHIINIVERKIIDGEIHIKDGKIKDIIARNDIKPSDPILLPGLIDAHVHIESSMLLPSNYAKIAVKHGVVGCVCDPHEIANVCGIEGIDYMVEDSKRVNFHFAFAAPSCVPATPFETSGFTLDSEKVKQLLSRKEFVALAEMMNVVGVINKQEDIIAKIQVAKQFGKVIDGHAPMLTKENLQKYISFGIDTDHECSTLEEAKEKIQSGMNILIREGSAAKNFDSLYNCIEEYPAKTMFCADDIHPDDLLNGYINDLFKRAFDKNIPIWNIIQTASMNPISHYSLPIGLLQKGDSADFIVVDNWENFNIIRTFINGQCVFDSTKSKDNQIDIQINKASIDNNSSVEENKEVVLPNNFHASKINEKDLQIRPQSSHIKVIKVYNKDLFTEKLICKAKIENDNIVSDTENDILKLVVYNRYQNSKPAIAFVRGFNLKNGALASTIAHDSHNIIALGTTDLFIEKAINELIEIKGGVCAVSDKKVETLPLPFGGLISNKSIEEVASKYKSLNNFASLEGCTLSAPFMTMAFVALLVIPELKLSDKGLFDVKEFNFTSLFE